jgi:RHS repeat-associated protein
MPNRTYTFLKNYRYGFNGKENDNDVMGVGNQIDYGERIYDPRKGGFDSVDPLFRKYPWWSSYELAGDNPIRSVDIDGKQVEDDDLDPLNQDAVRDELARDLKFPDPVIIPEEESKLPERPETPKSTIGERLLYLNNLLKNYVDDLPENTANALGNQTAEIREKMEQFNQNKANGQALEKVLTTALTKNLKAGQVANQVTLQIAGKINGDDVSVRIRVDNLTNSAGAVDLFEAKYSIEQITGKNYNRALTPNQRQAFNIFTNGTNVSILVRGNNGKEAGFDPGEELDLTNVHFNIVTNNTSNGHPDAVKSTPVKSNP